MVYTALLGEYDDLKNPTELIDGCDLLCFTNNRNLRSETLDIRRLNIRDMNNTRNPHF